MNLKTVFPIVIDHLFSRRVAHLQKWLEENFKLVPRVGEVIERPPSACCGLKTARLCSQK